MSYRTEFVQAEQRTKRLSLACPNITSSSVRFLTPEKQKQFPYALRDAVGELSLDDVVAQCFSIHWRIKEPLERFFSCPIIYTIGYVEYINGCLFENSEEDLIAMLKSGIKNNQANLHAWLTLPSDEIVDLSLSTSLAVIQNLPNGRGGVIAKHADELSHGMKYHPMLLGDDFLRKIGALVV